jgi:hypothetical protein
MITQAGSFRTRGITDHGVSTTKNGFPQFVALLRADEFFDVDLQQWVTLDTGEEMTGYFTLVDGQGKQTLNMAQVKKATGWNGTFNALAAMDLSNTPVQFRVEPHLYDGNTTLQINWIDEYDAVPGAKVKKLDENDLKALDAKYAALFKTAAKPATAPVSPTAAPDAQPKRKPGRPPKATANPTPAPAADPVATPATPVAAPTASKATPPPRTKAPAAAAESCTKEEAWDACYENKGDKDDDTLGTIWSEVIGQLAPGKEDEQITGVEWFKIKMAVIAQLVV